MRTLAIVLALGLGVVAAGCGGSGARPAAGPRCTTPRTARALARVQRDVAAIRRAALTVRAGQTFDGNDAVNKATDRFMLDVSTAPISNLQRNRLIDHAMSALVGSCEQCFQALEANRPIPAIKFRRGSCSG